jgi:nicotinic acid mononucleotide adenylyltransferase
MVVFTFGRMNPPTKGHEALINAARKIRANSGTSEPVFVFVTATQNIPNNPLSVNEKLNILNNMFRNVPNVRVIGLRPGKSTIKNAINQMRAHTNGGVPTQLVMGQNRINKGSFAFVNKLGIRRVSGGNRNMTSTNSGNKNIKKVSGTKTRQAAQRGENIKPLLSNKVSQNKANKYRNIIKARLNNPPIKTKGTKRKRN